MFIMEETNNLPRPNKVKLQFKYVRMSCFEIKKHAYKNGTHYDIHKNRIGFLL